MRKSIRTAAAAAALLLGAAAARADDVGLETGEILEGKVVEQTAMVVILEHPVLGKISIPRARVKFVVTDAEKMAAAEQGRRTEAATAKAAAGGTAAPAGAPAPETKAEWVSKLEVGINGAGGNTRSKNFIAGVRSERTRPRTILKFDARYTLSESGGETTQSRFTTGLRKDWLTDDPRWSWFAEARYDRDQFQEWSQRGNVAAGVLYKFIEKDDLYVGIRVGASGTKEWGSGEDHVRPEGLLGVEAKYKIDDSKEFTFQSTYYPDLTDRPEYRMLSSAGLSVRLDEKGTLNVRFGIEHEYDTHRSRDVKRTDYRYFALLVLHFSPAGPPRRPVTPRAPRRPARRTVITRRTIPFPPRKTGRRRSPRRSSARSPRGKAAVASQSPPASSAAPRVSRGPSLVIASRRAPVKAARSSPVRAAGSRRSHAPSAVPVRRQASTLATWPRISRKAAAAGAVFTTIHAWRAKRRSARVMAPRAMRGPRSAPPDARTRRWPRKARTPARKGPTGPMAPGRRRVRPDRARLATRSPGIRGRTASAAGGGGEGPGSTYAPGTPRTAVNRFPSFTMRTGRGSRSW